MDQNRPWRIRLPFLLNLIKSLLLRFCENRRFLVWNIRSVHAHPINFILHNLNDTFIHKWTQNRSRYAEFFGCFCIIQLLFLKKRTHKPCSCLTSFTLQLPCSFFCLFFADIQYDISFFFGFDLFSHGENRFQCLNHSGAILVFHPRGKCDQPLLRSFLTAADSRKFFHT